MNTETAIRTYINPISQASSRIRVAPRRLRRITLFACVAAMSLAATGCHNKDSIVVKQVSWNCPKYTSEVSAPKMKDDEGHITHAYKSYQSVRFHFVDQTNQFMDLYQPGLCEFLQTQTSRSLPMTIGLTKSPSGKLLSYEEVSLPGRELGTSELTRTSLFLAGDKDEIDTIDKIARTNRENSFFDDEPIPARRLAVDELLN